MQEEILVFLLSHLYAFAIMAAVVFRAQIKAFWKNTVSFTCSVWTIFWSAAFIVVSAGLTLMSAMGIHCGFALSNYASTHVLIVVCIMILFFAFMVAGFLLLNFVAEGAKVKKPKTVKPSFSLCSKLAVTAFCKPRFVMLQ